MKKLMAIALCALYGMMHAAAKETPNFKLITEGGLDFTAELAYVHEGVPDIYLHLHYSKKVHEHRASLIKNARDLTSIKIVPKVITEQMRITLFKLDPILRDELTKGAYLVISYNKETHTFELTRKLKTEQTVAELQQRIKHLEQQLSDCEYQLLYGQKVEEKKKKEGGKE